MEHVRDRDGSAIVAALIERRGYDREFAHALLDLSQNRAADWPVRGVAVLALESQLLALDPTAMHEIGPLLMRLGFVPSGGTACRSDVLKQGYTSTEPAAFFHQLVSRLSRLAPVHRNLRSSATASDAIARFRQLASQECLLALARAAFGPDEVFTEILRRVRVTSAEIERFEDNAQVIGEARAAIALLPEYEADILARLLGEVRSWWFSAATPAKHNALVSCPVGTCALIIRPPGSTFEFEIKRIGMRGSRALTVLYERGGEPIPPSHRLQGGASLSILQWEARNSALLSRLYRGIHHEAPPMSHVAQLRKVTSVPRSDGATVPLHDWFERPEAFGEGFQAMRRAMTQSLHGFVRERYVLSSVPRLPTARTRAFLRAQTPAQCTLIGTSALRLDTAAAWLGGSGADSYFSAVHGRGPTQAEACGFADAILMDILDSYQPPAAPDHYAAYVSAAFARNREAADRAYVGVLTSLGRMWGTLLGLRGYTEGESFVARNVGLRAVWADGAWSVRIIFMDHELTNVIGRRMRHFHPKAALQGVHKDWVHIVGGHLGGVPRNGTVATLAAIYRPDTAVRALGHDRMIEELRRSYRLTLAHLRDDAGIRSQFRKTFVNSAPAWDAVVGLYRASRVGARQRTAWKGQMRRVMAAYELDDQLVREYQRAIHRHRRMLRHAPYLFDPDGGA
ncbi:hypothetical protein JQ625_05260 [Bradyrhizobium diazoefficiens]|nr:hypothetical protein [Bradyrhizobium diazoefficiens]MBR0774234.1 hypothetical protein [Bradyrhizobium diazoefficiens]